MAFADLKTGESASRVDTVDLADSDDDLPDTHDVLASFDRNKRTKSARSSETHYSDPDIDNFIRNVHVLDQDIHLPRSKRSSTPAYVDEVDLTMSSPPPVTPVSTRKRTSERTDDTRISKKPKLSTQAEPVGQPAEVRTTRVPAKFHCLTHSYDFRSKGLYSSMFPQKSWRKWTSSQTTMTSKWMKVSSTSNLLIRPRHLQLSMETRLYYESRTLLHLELVNRPDRIFSLHQPLPLRPRLVLPRSYQQTLKTRQKKDILGTWQ